MERAHSSQSLARRAADRVAGRLYVGDHRDECIGFRWICQGGSERRDLLPIEAVGTDTNAHERRRDANEQSGHGLLAIALPEPQVEVILVGPLVPTQADIAVDPEDRAQDARLDVDPRYKLVHPRRQPRHERLGGLDVKEIGEFGPAVAHVEQAVLAPVREILIEGRATRELVVSDVDLAAVSLLGAIHMVAMMDIVTTGQLDADGRARALVPQLMRGLLPR